MENYAPVANNYQESLFIIKDSRTKYIIYIGFVEIYNEELKDLLNAKKLPQALKIREDPQTGIFIEGLTLKKIYSLEELNALISQGVRMRATSKTKFVVL